MLLKDVLEELKLRVQIQNTVKSVLEKGISKSISGITRNGEKLITRNGEKLLFNDFLGKLKPYDFSLLLP